MKRLSLILSAITFAVTLFFIITDFPDVTTIDGSIYLMLMVILLLICITGIAINKPTIVKARRKLKISKRKIRAKASYKFH